MISIPKKTSGIVKNLYFVSSKDELDKTIIHPGIPSNFLTRGKFSDWQTPRIRLYTSVSDALSGYWLGENLKGSELYVYRAKGIRNESLIKPSITSVPYALVLDEWWYLRNLGLDYLGKIKVISEAGKEIYHYGPRSTKAFVYKWKWEEIGLKSWEKSRLKPKEENNKNGKNMIIRTKRKTFSDSTNKVTRRKLFSDQEEENKEKSGKKVAKKIGGSVVAGAGTGALLGAGLGALAGGGGKLAATHKEREENRYVNRRLKYAQTQAKRREGRDWVSGNHREGYSYAGSGRSSSAPSSSSWE